MLPLLLKEHQTGTHRFDALLRRSIPGLLLNVMNVGEAPYIDKRWFQNEVQFAKIKRFCPLKHVPNLGELGFKVVLLLFFWLEMSISTQIINIGFKLYKPIALDRVERWTILPPPPKKGTKLEPSSPKLGTCQN